MENCFDCRHKKVKFSDLDKVDEDMELVSEGVASEKMYIKCLVGQNRKMQEFYKNNVHLSRARVQAEGIKLNCFEPTETAIMLDSIIDKAENLLNLLKEK